MTFAAEYQDSLDGPDTDIRGHLAYLHNIACWYPRVRVLELGTRTGESTRAFLAAADKTGGHVWSVDTEVPQVPDHWFESRRWTFTQGDDMAEILPQPARVNVLFIDTSHDFGATIAELYKFVPRVLPRGRVLLHDTEWKPPDHPVARALDIYCAETGRTWRNMAGYNGLGEIEIP